MLFSSISFLYYFLPIVLVVYFAVPFKAKNLVLLLFSLIFYFYGGPNYLILLVASALVGWGFGLLIDRFRGRTGGKVFLCLSLISSLGVLGVFKYADFAIGNFNAVFGASLPLSGLVLPIGISFYTFQIMSYTIDVYRGDARVQKNPLTLLTYVALFPQLIAGPIVRYSTIEGELEKRTHSFGNAAYGAQRFVLGLAKKVLIANALGEFCALFRQTNEPSVLFYWLYAIAFSLQIYFDFSGYSDMAIGLGRIFGFHFLENFNYPFISKSITEFWRRWHISLGTWFRDYLYIPMGGNRVKKWRWLVNIAVVWMLTGLWHGASWNFVLWGAYFAVFLIIEKLFLGKLLEQLPKVVSHLYLIVTVLLSFVLFNAETLQQCISDIGAMFGAGGIPFVTAQTLYYLRSYAVLLVVAIVGATPLAKWLVQKVKLDKTFVIAPLALAALLIVVTAYLVDGGFNPFLYFRF